MQRNRRKYKYFTKSNKNAVVFIIIFTENRVFSLEMVPVFP